MAYRSITPDEIPAFAEISGRGFRYDSQRTVTSLTRPEGRYDLSSCFVYETEDRGKVAAMVAFPRNVSIGGQLLEASLIASVSVPPDQRRRGYANAMLTSELRRVREQNMPLSFLWPYSIPFYNRLGYGLATFGRLLELPLNEMPNFDEMRSVRLLTADDLPAMQRLYAKEQQPRSGWVERTDFEWRMRVLENEGLTWPHKLEGVVVPGADGELLGYMLYHLTYNEGNPPYCFTIYEWVDNSDDPTGFRALAGYTAAQQAQARFLRYTAPLDSMLPLLFRNWQTHRIPRETQFVYRDSSSVGAGMMGRLVHAAEAFQQRGYPSDVAGACLIQISDSHLPENETPFLLEIENGRGAVVETTRTAALAARADVRTWSELYANTITAREAWQVGRLEADAATRDFLTAAFTSTPWFIHRADWF